MSGIDREYAEGLTANDDFGVEVDKDLLLDLIRERDEWKEQHANALACWKTDVANVVESANFQAMAKLCDEIETLEGQLEEAFRQRDEVTEKWHALRESRGAVPDKLRAIAHALEEADTDAAYAIVNELLGVK